MHGLIAGDNEGAPALATAKTDRPPSFAETMARELAGKLATRSPEELERALLAWSAEIARRDAFVDEIHGMLQSHITRRAPASADPFLIVRVANACAEFLKALEVPVVSS